MKRFNNFIKESFFRNLNVGDKAKIENELKRLGVKNYTINDDLTVDVDGDVDISNKGLTKIPVKFGVVRGDFNCKSNQLTKLENVPKEVGGNFSCSFNRLVSLEGAPKKVGGSFWCFNIYTQFTEEDIREVCDVKGNIYTNLKSR